MSYSFVTPLTVACQAPLSTGFPRQEYWSGLPFSSPADLPGPRDWTCGRFFTIWTTRGDLLIMLVQCVCSVASNSSWPRGLKPTRCLCPWDFPGKNTGVGCHFILQGIFPTQGTKPHLLHLLHWQVDSLPLYHQGNPRLCFKKVKMEHWEVWEIKLFCVETDKMSCTMGSISPLLSLEWWWWWLRLDFLRRDEWQEHLDRKDLTALVVSMEQGYMFCFQFEAFTSCALTPSTLLELGVSEERPGWIQSWKHWLRQLPR